MVWSQLIGGSRQAFPVTASARVVGVVLVERGGSISRIGAGDFRPSEADRGRKLAPDYGAEAASERPLLGNRDLSTFGV